MCCAECGGLGRLRLLATNVIGVLAGKNSAGFDDGQLAHCFVHHVIKRKMPQAAAVPPERLTTWRDALLDAIASGRCASSRGRFNPRGAKRKMSDFHVRHRGELLHQ